jgi:L-ribulokinase
MTIVAGVDFGTASVRVAIVDAERGRLGGASAEFPTRRSPTDPNLATQRHEDHCEALMLAMEGALHDAGVKGDEIASLGIATTGSTVAPLDERLVPLDDYYLWCDHRAWREAADITQRARQLSLPSINWCGGTYSSEWGFAKALHWLRNHPPNGREPATFAEHCDIMVAQLTGIRRVEDMPRSICAMGHKWMWNESCGGLPSSEFLLSVDPLLAGARDQLGGTYRTSRAIAGTLCEPWATRLGLKAGIPIPVGALDAHWDAIGAGCRLGDIVNVLGTSTCVMALSERLTPIPGVSGVVDGSVHPGFVGIEAGLSAAGDLFEAIARRAGRTLAELSTGLEAYRAGQTGLLRFAWDNGDRSVLMNPNLKGMTLGWRLHHTAQDELHAAIEGTAFQTRIILERLKHHGAQAHRVINAGGIPQKNEALNRIYASIFGRPVLVPASEPTGLGSAIFAFLAAGTFKSVESAQDALCPTYRTIEPGEADLRAYADQYAQFRDLYFSLGQLAALDGQARGVNCFGSQMNS